MMAILINNLSYFPLISEQSTICSVFPAFLSGTVVEHRSDNNKMSTVTVVDIAWPLIETKNQANSYLWGSIWIQLGAAIYNAQGKFEHQGWR